MFAGALVLPGCAAPSSAALPTTAFAGALVSPAAPAPTGDDLYARLIGSWSVNVTDYGDDGTVHRDTGEWHFSRILDGRGVQDVWISPPRSARGTPHVPGPFDRFGTSIRTPLAGGTEWKVIWLNPVRNVEVQLVGRRVGDHIVQEGDQPDGARLRWTFDELGDNTFHWLGERSRDGGKTWARIQDMAGTRMASSAAPAPPAIAGPPASPAPSDATAMIRALHAGGPHPTVADGAAAFDWLQGSWDLECDLFLDGEHRHSAGEWHFGWIVDGRMMQDALYFYPPGKPEQRTGGTSIRMYDPDGKQWTVMWLTPRGKTIVSLVGGKVGDRIVLRGGDSDGTMIRWSFNDIRADAFHWLGEKSRDGGATWAVEQDMRVRRRR
jgi:hypothetical protein